MLEVGEINMEPDIFLLYLQYLCNQNWPKLRIFVIRPSWKKDWNKKWVTLWNSYCTPEISFKMSFNFSLIKTPYLGLIYMPFQDWNFSSDCILILKLKQKNMLNLRLIFCKSQTKLKLCMFNRNPSFIEIIICQLSTFVKWKA